MHSAVAALAHRRHAVVRLRVRQLLQVRDGALGDGVAARLAEEQVVDVAISDEAAETLFKKVNFTTAGARIDVEREKQERDDKDIPYRKMPEGWIKDRLDVLDELTIREAISKDS